MNLRSVDLNLLVALDVLLSERHVTRAAEKIGLSQPAMSNALTRLRLIFQDELLVRTSTGMQPTPRAMELAEPTRQVLRQIERVFVSDSTFDPLTASRTFTIRLSDVPGLLLLPPLFEGIGTSAPGVKFEVLHLPPTETVDGLEKDELDFAVSMGLVHSSSIKSEILCADNMVCVMRDGHPAAGAPLTLERFLQEKHLKVSISPTDLRFVDDVLSRQNLSRTVALNVPHWLLVPHVLEQSDLIAVMPRRFALAMHKHALAIRELPFPSEPFEWTMYWHRRQDGNQAINWLRAQLKGIAEGWAR